MYGEIFSVEIVEFFATFESFYASCKLLPQVYVNNFNSPPWNGFLQLHGLEALQHCTLFEKL